MTTLHLRKSIGRSPCRRAFLLIPFAIALVWFALSPTARAALPPPAPDGGYPNGNTAEGNGALFSLTTGIDNTACGSSALHADATGSCNTATGWSALWRNTGSRNTAYGCSALELNTTGSSNTANGATALFSNTTGGNNTASGDSALQHNTTGVGNTANGFGALGSNTTANSNIALGASAGKTLTTGSNNIDIGNVGVAGESSTIRIGSSSQIRTFIAGIHGAAVTGTAVVVNSSGQLGVAPSSERFKDEITPMDKVSEAILALKPVTFHYKKDLDPKGIPQFGLVAEEVEKVNPSLVARDAKGEVYTVRYEAVNAMLLNEFLKEHRTVQELKSKLAQQEKDFQSTATQQGKEIKALSAGLQKVSARLEVSKAAPQTVLNNQ